MQETADLVLVNGRISLCGCNTACNVHGHLHARSWNASVPVSEDTAFWGALGCSCWAF
jgi:hypothetical protein